MKKTMNKLVLFLTISMSLAPLQDVYAEQKPYLERLGTALQRRIDNKVDYVKSDRGIEDSIDGVLGLSAAIIGVTAYVAFIMYIQKKMMGSIMSQQGMHIHLPGKISTKFADVAGLSGPKADMQDIITYLKNPQIYKKIGAKVPKGVLMNGGPGNGKTLLAKAVAGEVNCPFISINGSAFVQMYVGLGAARIRDLFTTARALSYWYGGCIIFIDEIDSLALARSGGSGGNTEHDQTLNALLAEMDGLDVSGSPVIVLGATNRASLLDPAVVRPGRFDRKVEVTKPVIKDRIELLQIALKTVKQAENINIDHIARATQGFSGAELANLINEAAILAANDGKEIVDIKDIELAFDNITLGREITSMQQSQDKKWKTAVHEAGHALSLMVVDQKYALHKISITPRSNTLGVMHMVPLYESYESTQDDMKNAIVVALCGRLAEQEFGMGLSTGASSDLQKAHSIAYNMVASYGMSDALHNISYSQRNQLPNDIGTQVEREVQKIIDECTVRGKQLVKEHRKAIENIAHLLMEKGTVLGDEVYALLGMPLPDVQFSLA